MEFKTIATFSLPSDLYVAKSKLESEGIECRVLDELTVQSYHFLSTAVGGVKLQVVSKDADKAYSLLLEGGFVKAEALEQSYVERKFNNPAFLKRFKFIALLFFAFIALLVLLLPFWCFF